MNELKKKLAILLAVCMIMTNVLPAFAEPVYEPLTTEDQYTETEETELTLAEESSEYFEYEQATPPNASYNELCIDEQEEAGLADDEYTGLTEFEDNPDELIPEEATPANARYTDEIFIREAVVDGMTITLTADPGVFPEDAELWAEKVEDEVTEEAIEEAVEKERENNVNVAASYKFDIKMFVNGEEVQPDKSKGSVKVTFTLAEELSECLDANAYHLKEDAAGELTAENLSAEVKTVEEADEETVKEAGNTSETASTVGADEDGILADGIIEDDVTKKVTKLEADTYGFSYYVVEFTYDELQYVLPGDSSIKLSKILNTLKIEGTVTAAEVSDEKLFSVEKDNEGDDWTVTAHQAFSSKEWMKLTMEYGQVYEIVVTDDGETHTHNGITFVPWDGGTEHNLMPGNAGNYYLTADITLSGTWVVPLSGTTNLCLNGHVIKANVTAGNNFRVIQVGETKTATLNLYDCNTSTSHPGYIDTDGLWHLVTEANEEESKPITGGIITGGSRSGNGGGVLVWGGEFNMYGGTICGNQTVNNSNNGGGVSVGANYSGNLTGYFNMYGGEILGNLSTGGNGGGVYVGDKGKFNMYGGTISRNKASQGGGVYVANDDSVTLGGTAIITDNKKKVDDSNNNLYLSSGKTITLAEEENLPATGMSVGVTASKTPTDLIPIQISSNYVSGAEQYFFSDVSEYSVSKSNDKLYLGCSYTVTFDKNGGDSAAVPATISEINGAYYVLPTTAPTKAGHTFAGWFTETTGGTQVTTNTTVSLTAEQTLYAHWTANQYSIVYKDKDGADFSGTHGADHPTKHTYGTETTLKTATKTGYTFGGWFTAPDCSGSAITSLGASVYTADITLYAKWTANKYTVTFDKNGGDTEVESAAIEETYDAKYTLPTTAPTKAGHTFAGWFTEATDGTQVTADTTVKTASAHTLYAHWTVNIYTVTITNNNPEYGSVSPASISDVPYGTEFTTSGNILTVGSTKVTAAPAAKTDQYTYNFKGWSPASGTVTGDTTITASFERVTNKYGVTFDNQGHGGVIAAQNVEYGSKVNKPTDPAEAGYTFGGWYKEAACTNAWNFSTDTVKGNRTLYAKWTANKYKVTFDKNGGDTEAEPAAIEETYDAKYTLPKTEPTKAGYTFAGWFTAAADGTQVTAETKVNLTGPQTLYAHWTANQYDIVYKDKGDAAFSGIHETGYPTKHTYGTATNLKAASKTGYTFGGWFDNSACSGSPITSLGASGYTADITLYAKWTANSYTVTFNKNGGDTEAEPAAIEETYNAKYTLPTTAPTKSGYTFAGWFKAATDGTQVTADTTVKTASAHTLYAHWTVKSRGGSSGGGSSERKIRPGSTYSPNWFADASGAWRIRNSKGEIVKSAWLSDNVIPENGNNVWYLLGADGAMVAAGLVQDKTGNFYSLETEHNGYFGMLRYQDGYYNCNGQQVYLTFNRQHNGSFGAVTNADGIEKLKAIYGVTQYGIGNENAVYTATF